LNQKFPNFRQLTQQVTIPFEDNQDKLLRKHTNNGDLQLKEVYGFKMQKFQELH